MQDFFATGKPARGGRVRLRAKVDTDIGEAPGKTGFVEAVIRGTRPGVQQIVLTAHLQEEQGSANDDGSGCANLLELARVFSKLIKEGKMKRPQRDLRFWWTDEIFSEYQLFREHPEEMKKILANVHQDMTGANLAMGSRVQHLIFAPHSRTSYLDAIFESVGTYLINTNNGFLSASRQGGLPRPHTRPLYSTRGTRQGYNARFVPHFGSSDHLVFLEGAVGIPAVALINWDDPYIHSSDDDLFQIDQTQLRRNNFLIGSLAYFLSKADDADVPLLVAETYAQGQRRLANDMRVAMELLVAERGEAGRRLEAREHHRRAGRLARGARARIHPRLRRGQRRRATHRRHEGVDDLQQRADGRAGAVLQTTARAEPAAAGPADRRRARGEQEGAGERRLARTYLTNRNKVPCAAGGALHGLMRTEVYNFVDGRRSYYDIYKAVYAESAAAGSWYYGTVTLEDVVRLLDAAVAARALTLK